MPHPTTLMKLTTRCGSAAIDGLNEALLAKAAEAKLLGTNRIRADTTVARANVSYPTDLGLLAKAMRRIAATGKRIQAAGGAVRTRVGDRSRAAGRRAHAVAAKLRSRAELGRDEARAAVLRFTGELASWPKPLLRRPSSCWTTPSRRCSGPRPRPPRWPPAVSVMRSRVAAVVGWCARSTT